MTAEDVAKWMLQKIEDEGELYQQEAADEIQTRFGEKFTYENENGNTAIGRDVLAAFKKISEDVIWERGNKLWRKREDYDEPSRAQY